MSGADWRDGIFDSTVEGGVVRLGGVILSPNLSGTRLHLFSIAFRVLPKSSMDHFLTATVNILTEYGVGGTTIGEPTPRNSTAAGKIPYGIMNNGEGKRSIRSGGDRFGRTTRERRQTSANCSLQGDADENCLVDLVDVAYLAMFLSERLTNFSTTQGAAIQGKISTSSPNLDANLNSALDWNDVIHFFKALFGLLPVLESLNVTPVQDPNSQCEFGISLALTTPQGQPYNKSKVYIDVSFDNSTEAALFISSLSAGNITALVVREMNPFGAVVQLQPSLGDSGSFSIRFPLNLTGSIDLSLILIQQDTPSVEPPITLVGIISPTPKYPMTSYMLGEVPISFPSGYNPLVSPANSLSSSNCISLQFGPVHITFPNSRSANITWTIENLNSDIHSIQSITVYVRECPVGTDVGSPVSSMLSDGCVERIEPASNITAHFTLVDPYKDYHIQIRSQVSTSEFVSGTSPQDSES